MSCYTKIFVVFVWRIVLIKSTIFWHKCRQCNILVLRKKTDRQTWTVRERYIDMHDDREDMHRQTAWQIVVIYLSTSWLLFEISSDALGACTPKLADPCSSPLCTWFKNSPCCKISGSTINMTKDVQAITSRTILLNHKKGS